MIVDSRLIIIRILDDDGNIYTKGGYSRHIEQERRDFNKSSSSFFLFFTYKGGEEKWTFLEVFPYRLSSFFRAMNSLDRSEDNYQSSIEHAIEQLIYSKKKEREIRCAI